jgi:hypothetical protein
MGMNRAARAWRRFWHPLDVDIIRIVPISSPISDVVKNLLRNTRIRVDNEFGGLVGFDLSSIERLAEGAPVNRMDVRYLLRAAFWAPTMGGVERTEADVQRVKCLQTELKLALDDMDMEKASKLSLQSQLGEQDVAGFQKRIARWSVIGTVCSALASLGSLIVAYLQYIRHN